MHHFYYRSTSTGVLLRGGLITAIYSRSLRLTTRARSSLPNGRLVNHISTDVSRIDFCSGFFHIVWAAPIQMAICLVQLLIDMGPSALAGFAFFIFITPVQAWIMSTLVKVRIKTMVWTDKRAKMMQELLGGMKVIKYFAWEIPMLKRIGEYRQREMRYLFVWSHHSGVLIRPPFQLCTIPSSDPCWEHCSVVDNTGTRGCPRFSRLCGNGPFTRCHHDFHVTDIIQLATSPSLDASYVPLPFNILLHLR